MRPDRITFLDTVRGVALLGILLMNVQSFADVSAAYLNPTATGPLSGANLAVWAIVRLLADQKFLGLFAMLFGAGLVLYTDGAAARGDDVLRLHRRRMGWLVAFGLLHATLIWHGDVLFCYGVCGLVVVGAREWAPNRLILTSILVSGVGSSVWLAGGLTYRWWPPELAAQMLAAWAPDAAAQAAEVAAYRSGWLGQMVVRLPQALENELGGLLFLMGWKAASLMLLGMALYRLDVLTGRAEPRVYRRLASAGFGVGLPLTALGMALDWNAGFSAEFSFFFGGQLHGWASYAVALGWVGLLGAVRGHRLEPLLAAVGRMAFTNYILDSALGTLVFYGHGLGWFGSVDRVGQLAVVAALWAVNLGGSWWWLQRFRQGPLEWLWRGLVRGRMEPLAISRLGS
ncbi:MAG: DUF418 domain-containing protein [Myxococcota bacterium]